MYDINLFYHEFIIFYLVTSFEFENLFMFNFYLLFCNFRLLCGGGVCSLLQSAYGALSKIGSKNYNPILT